MALRWSVEGRVVLARFTAEPAAADLDALANVLEEVHQKVGERLLLAQLGRDIDAHKPSIQLSGTVGPLARYTSVVRKLVEENHTVVAGGGWAGGALRRIINVVGRFSPRTSMYENSDEMVFALANRYGIDAARLRERVRDLLQDGVQA